MSSEVMHVLRALSAWSESSSLISAAAERICVARIAAALGCWVKCWRMESGAPEERSLDGRATKIEFLAYLSLSLWR